MIPAQSNHPEKSKRRSIRDDIDSLAMNVAQIKHVCQGLIDRMDVNEFITPEALRETDPNNTLSRTYSVVDVAQIAAGCMGETYQDRVLEAMRLLEAAEEIAKPNPWKNQSSETDAEEDAAYNRFCERTNEAWKIVRECTTKDGVPKMEVLAKVYVWCGRSGKSDAQGKAYTKWADKAVEGLAEISAWRDYISKHPEKQTPIEYAAWRKTWKSRKAKFDTGEFLKQFERPCANGRAAYFLNQEWAVTALAGNGKGDFTALMESWMTPKARRLLHDPVTQKYVAHGDRKNCKTR